MILGLRSRGISEQNQATTLSQNRNPALISERGFSEITPAATYSRASYTGTTIGPAAFHGRVRNGNGWDHRGKTTGKSSKPSAISVLPSAETVADDRVPTTSM